MGIIVSVIACSACKDTSFQRGEEIAYRPVETERYENQMEIDGQWGSSAATGADGQYGIGDPFVMRYNGKYYLYPSTSDPCDGIKVFESDDAVHWTYRGLAVAETEPTAHGAYAPEVVYYNGYFYMCQSRAGKGHYIYRSESPTEGFTLISKSENVEEGNIDYGNLGMGIDGSFYLSDDGRLYLLHTSTPAGLKYNEITAADDISAKTLGKTGTLGDANLNHWIEGPGIFRRGDYSYLTYTGNHVFSKGYRVAYSYAENLGEDLSAFTQPVDNVTLIDTSEEHYGLGHSSNFNGPDLDSVYTAYHSLVGNGPARRYNIDRYFAWGGLLTANGVTHRPVAVPQKPAASAINGEELTLKNGRYTLGETENCFTAEYNLIPAEGQRLYFGNGYSLRFTEAGISLEKDGSQIAEKSTAYPKNKLNTVRVENGDGVGYVYLNGMRLIGYEAESAKGEIAYETKEGVYYTAFANDVFGTSDFEAVKNLSARFPAITYLKGENRGFSLADAKTEKGGVRVGEKQNAVKTEDGEYAVKMNRNGDWIKYAVDIPESGGYSFSARIAGCTAAKVKITVGNSVHTAEIPSSKAAVNVSLGMARLEAGVTTMKVELLSGEAEFVWFDVQSDAESEKQIAVSSFDALNGSCRLEGNTLIVSGSEAYGDDGVAVWGGRGMSDYEAELTFSSPESSADFGFMVRANDYSYFKDQPAQSWRGYYVQITPQIVSVSRYDYGEEILDASRHGGFTDGREHVVKIIAKGNGISVEADGKKILSVTDSHAFLYGKFGVFVRNGKVELKNYKFKLL